MQGASELHLEQEVQSIFDELGHDDGLLTDGIEKAAEVRGDIVYQEALRFLAGKEFPPCKAKQYWHEVLAYRSQLFSMATLGGALRPTLLHYLHRVVREIHDPRIVEATHLQLIRKASITDGLTGLYHQTHFKDQLGKLLEMPQKPCGSHFAVVMLDLDHFKAYNDRCGHLTGDQALKLVAETIQINIRQGDIAARYGGEEFAILLHRVTEQQAFTVAERIRATVESLPFPKRQQMPQGRLTISGGLAMFREGEDTVNSLIERADQELYRAKQQRNRICPHHDNIRQSVRHQMQSMVEFTLPEGQSYATGLTFDISEGGISIGCDSQLSPGATLHLRFRRPFWPTDCELTAKVRHAKKDKNGIIRLGLQFDETLDMIRPLLPEEKADMDSRRDQGPSPAA